MKPIAIFITLVALLAGHVAAAPEPVRLAVVSVLTTSATAIPDSNIAARCDDDENCPKGWVCYCVS